VRRNFAVSQAPRGVIAAAVVGLMLLVLPVLAMLLRVPWSALPEIVTDEANRSALLLSLRTSVLATLLSVAVGAPVAWLIAHYSFPGMRVLCGSGLASGLRSPNRLQSSHNSSWPLRTSSS